MNADALNKVISHKQLLINNPVSILNCLLQKLGSTMQTTVARTPDGLMSSFTVAYRHGDLAIAYTVPCDQGIEDIKAHISQLKANCCTALLDKHGEALCEEILKRKADRMARHTSAEILEMARARWPQAFNEAYPLPLTKGVNQVVQEALGLNVTETRIFFKHWCASRFYLQNTISTKQRINLDGSPAEAVTEDELKWARTRLLRFKRKVEKKADPEQQDAKKLYATWSTRWPKVFSRENPLPINRPSVVWQLKAETGLPHEIVITTLKWWSRRIEYRTACTKHSEMFDLSLTPAPKEARHLLQPNRG